MNMIPDAGLPAQPTELYRVDIDNSTTDVSSVLFNATTEDEAKTTALGFVNDNGGDSGHIYQHNGVGRGNYCTTVPVPLTPWPGLSVSDLERVYANGVTLGDVLDAVVAGVRTEQQMADKFGTSLRGALSRLLCADLLYMQDEPGQPWLYKPTRKGRELVKARQGGAS